MVVGNSGPRWTEVISCLDGLILQESVCEIIEKENFTGFKAHPIAITEIKSKKLRSLPVPQYYLLEITGRIDIDVNELDDVGGSICPVCFRRDAQQGNPYRWREKRIVPKLDTWNNADFVKLRNWRCGMKYCSKRFIDLASKYKWHNFIFGESLPGVAMWERAPANGQSYLDPDWFEKVSYRVEKRNPDLFGKNDDLVNP